MKWMWLGICVIGLGSAGALAQATVGSDDAERNAPREGRDRGEEPHRHLQRPMRFPWLQDSAQPSEEEWQQVAKFMKENSPKRWATLEHALGDEKAMPRAKRWMYGRWKMLQGLRKESKELYEQHLRTMRLEDEVFGLARNFRDTRDDAARKAMKEQIRGKVAELVRAGMEERRLRIQRTEALLKEEKERLERDNRDMDSLINRRLEAELKPGFFKGLGGGRHHLGQDALPKDEAEKRN